jgi:hypothetical protein
MKDLFENEGYIPGYSPKDKLERERRENENHVQSPKSDVVQASNAAGGVLDSLSGKEQGKRLLRLLSNGTHYSVVDISDQIRIADPRAVIRSLRKAGCEILDEWCVTDDGHRYKRYWLKR